MNPRPKILHVINGVDAGGAQTLLEKLAAGAHPSWDLHLLVLLGPGALSERLEPHFTTTTYLNFERKSRRLDSLVRQVAQVCRQVDPDIVHSHLVQADLAVALARRSRRGAGKVSTIHTAGLSFGERRLTRFLAAMLSVLGRRFDATVACTPQSLDYMLRRGYPPRTSLVIPNGVVVQADPMPASRSPVMVALARWHPVKDFPTLMEAFRQVKRVVPEARLLCAGFGIDESNDELGQLIAGLGLTDAVAMLGPIDDVDSLLRNAKGLVISSRYEALPMAGLEALAAGTPVVTTDVGDTKALTVESFQLAPPGDSQLLAAAMVQLLTLPEPEYESLSRRSHLQALRRFDIRNTVDQYDSLYRSVMASRADEE